MKALRSLIPIAALLALLASSCSKGVEPDSDEVGFTNRTNNTFLIGIPNTPYQIALKENGSGTLPYVSGTLYNIYNYDAANSIDISVKPGETYIISVKGNKWYVSEK